MFDLPHLIQSVSCLGLSGMTSARPYNPYSLLRTLQDGWGLPTLREAAKARPMTDLFGP
ncbi:hypothetical protein [Deinococcus arenicola]|uniref:Uncharacterized protein n=1 Tax=Deinococcus arenicola TaxID=2994950 RepID=A0ABU4DT72_9DEIO|nr:hypothetical protein [Deinococcus sp. ZS9-10]MDV6374884.1 hypothetical protein [Deinococcus sp. ZS9-10]